eukprot:TRINITY_DN23899_c0_g1_i2.p4 TRINITY_DN23899_c0_g1~~TRINITY_DN23899_c0_g1_i2.p4  ORF type:complete len:103 (+),score=26.11 TRINITY_DN23899_c0_g1_i2:111-419(+)
MFYNFFIFFFFLMIRRPPRSTHCISSAASDVYKRQGINAEYMGFIQIMFLPFNSNEAKPKEKSVECPNTITIVELSFRCCVGVLEKQDIFWKGCQIHIGIIV